MGLLRKALEKRNIHDPNVPLTGQALIDLMAQGNTTDSGMTVTAETSMRQTAVYRCVSLISGSVAGLPFHVYKNGTREQVPSKVVDDPHPELTPYDWKELTLVHLLLRGNSYDQKIRNGHGEVVELWPMGPDAVNPKRVKSTKANPSGKVYEITLEDGSQVEWTDEKILHIPGLGYDGVKGLSAIEAHRQGIGLGMAAETYGAKFFGSGSMMSGILTTEKNLQEEGADALKQRWKKKVSGLDRAHEIAVLDNGAKFQPVSIAPNDAQFIETRKFQLGEVARMFGVPPHMIADTEKSTSWGSGIEFQQIHYVVYTLRPWLNRIEQRFDKHVLNGGVYSRFKVDGLLRGDSKARGEFYAQMLQNRVMSPNEVRALEELEPYEGGDEMLETPNNSANDGGTESDED